MSNLDSILKELSNMKFSDNDGSRSSPSNVPRKSSVDHQRTQTRLTTNFDNLLDELQETQDFLEKDSFSKDSISSKTDRVGRRKYSNCSNNSGKAYSRSRSRSRHEVDHWKDNSSNSNSVPTSPIETKKFPSRISSMNPSNKLKLHLSTISQQINNRPRENSKTSSRAPSIKVPEKLQNYEFDDGDSGNLPLSYRDDYENMMNNYYNTSPKSNPYKTSSKPSSKFNSPIASPEIYSKSYNSNNEIGSPRSDRRSKRINNKKRYSDDESNEDEYSYRNSRRAPSRKSKYEEEEEDIFMYENDVDDYRSRKSSPTNSHNRKAFNEDDFDEDESDITFSESSDSFSSSEDDSSEASESETDDDNLPLRNTKAKPSGIRGRNRHYKKFNKLETSSYKEEKSPIKSSKSTSRKSLTPKMEKKKKTLSIPTQKYSQPSPGIKSPKENIYEDTAKENFLARSKKDFTSDFAEASVKKITTRIYIGDAKTYESVMLTSVMTVKEVIKDIIRRRNIMDSPEWTLFELCNDFGVERPLKEWEIVTDIITSWDIQRTKNALIIKQYNYYESLLASSAVGRFPSIRGKIYMETKPGKYNKRQFELRPNGLFYYKKKNNQETLLVNLASYDVYTLLVQMPNAPTDFAFAIKSTDPIHFFEDKKKYIYYLYATDVNSLFDWVMSIRQGKTEKYVLEQHEKENSSPGTGISSSRSPNVAVPKVNAYRGQQTLLEDRQRIKAMEIQKSKKLQKEANGPLVQIDSNSAARHKSISRKSTGSTGLKPSLSGRRKEKSGPLINLDGIQVSNSRKAAQTAMQTPLSSNSRRGPKPLVDISDAKNCHYCGCSENKYDPWKQNVCANCHHDHRSYQ